MHAREPPSFWRENVVAVVSLPRVLASMSWWRKQVIKFDQMLQIFSFSDLERAQPPSMEISVLTLVVKNSTKKISGVSILENRRENVKLNAALVVVLVFESKPLLFTLTVLTSISVEISRKVARARKRKINRPRITLFSWSYS